MRPGSPPGPPVTTPRPGAAVVRRLGGAQVHQHQHVTRAWSSNSSSTSWVRAAATRRLKQRSWSSPAGHGTTSSPARHGTPHLQEWVSDLLNHRAGLVIAGVANIASYRKLYYRVQKFLWISLAVQATGSYRKFGEIMSKGVLSCLVIKLNAMHYSYSTTLIKMQAFRLQVFCNYNCRNIKYSKKSYCNKFSNSPKNPTATSIIFYSKQILTPRSTATLTASMCTKWSRASMKQD